MGIYVCCHGGAHSGDICVLSWRGSQWGHMCVVMEGLTVGTYVCCHGGAHSGDTGLFPLKWLTVETQVIIMEAHIHVW